MSSNRHKRTDHDTVLDAARDSVLAVGVRRTTLTDVARRAGVSRMTLYRRWPDVRTLVADLMTREWTAVAAAVAPPGDGRPVRAAMVESLVQGARAFREHPLLRKIVDVDPELLLPYLLDRRGASQETFLELLEATIRAGQRDGTIRDGHPARQARSVLLIVQAFALSVRTMATGSGDPELTEPAFDHELRHILDRTLTP
ncbi:MAG: putative TetR-family transcriptional regulator [Streptosporangiaceae bacterium]|jgi:AcrR family transcriptional regulator|nr:putative TetR-family transcriptional regulator [Streptosporangiaceae bacterium]